MVRPKSTFTVDTKFYQHLDHGYAATVHKAQGATVDRTYVLATPHFDRHTTYVALSRHREAATVFCATDDFGGRGGRLHETEVNARLVERLSRVQAKDLAHDYLHTPEEQRDEGSAAPPQTRDEIQAAAIKNWRQERERTTGSRDAPVSLEEIGRQAVKEWLKLRAQVAQERATEPEATAERSMESHKEREEKERALERVRGRGRGPGLSRDLGRDDDTGLD